MDGPAPGAPVALRELTAENHAGYLSLRVAPAQERFVANNWVSMAQAHFRDDAWCRGISAGESPVGFVACVHEAGAPTWYLWRYMVDERHQRRGFGRRALELVIEHARGVPGVEEVKLSFVDADGSPEAFYSKLGFRRTGEVEDGEQVMRLALR